MLSFKNCNVYLNNNKIVKTDLTIDNGKFVSLNASNDAITLNDKYIIVPGFIEQHMHGSSGVDVMDGNEKAIHLIGHSILQNGVTSWIPTTMTLTKSEIISALKVLADIKHLDNEAKIQGIHLEGPFISKQFKGCQDERNIVEPNVKDLDDFVKASNNKVKMVSIAVEHANKEFFDYAKAHNIVVSLGHSAATGDDVKKAFKIGLGCITHIYNAMDKSFEQNSLISEIEKEDIYVEIILDLFHVPVDVCKNIFKFKKDKIILITDAMAGRYMPNGIYRIGKTDVIVKDNKALLPTGKKAGSVLQIPQGLKNVKQVCDLSIEQTIDLVAKHPADNLGLKDVGCIKLNNPADFVIIDKDFNIYQTYVNGKLVFDSHKLN